MTADQYTEFVDFLGRKFDAIERRFDAIERRLSTVEHRLTALEVSHEAMRREIRALVESQAAVIASWKRDERARTLASPSSLR